MTVHASPYRFGTFYSGSGGNAAYLETPEGILLIDAGKNARALCNGFCQARLNPDNLRAIFITHEHSDHIAALPVFLKKHRVPVHVTEPSSRKLLSYLGETEAALTVVHPPLYETDVGSVHVSSFYTSHDSAMSVGYRFDFGGVSVAVATDTGVVTDGMKQALPGCESVILESNHDPEMLRTGPYPYDLKLRIASRRGHLSNADCADFAASLTAGGTKNILLAHLSAENNTPEIAYDEVFSAVSDESVNLCIASPADAVCLYDGLSEREGVLC